MDDQVEKVISKEPRNGSCCFAVVDAVNQELCVALLSSCRILNNAAICRGHRNVLRCGIKSVNVV